MSRKKRNNHVSPIYAVAAFWLAWALVLPLFTIMHYLPLIILCVLLYKMTDRIATKNDEKKKAAETVPQQPRQPKPAEEKKSTGNPQVDKLIKERDLAISEMRRLNANIENEKISRQINDLEYTTSKIFDHVIAHPDKVSQISKFLNYYLPTTMKLLNTYDRMGAQGVEGVNISGTMKKVEETLDMVVEAFHKQLDTLFAGEALDVSADIQVMENLMKTEGLATDENQINLTLSE